MGNTLNDLRDHLFDALKSLKEAKPVLLESEIKRATAVRLVAEQVIETAKVEVALRKVLKVQPASEFFNVPALTDGTEKIEQKMQLVDKN
jgi:hypothetical protein